MRRATKHWATVIPVLAAAWVAAALFAQPAPAADLIQDGGFDLAICTTGVAGDCVSPFWSEENTTRPSGPIGPICQAQAGGCFITGTYLTPANWAAVGVGWTGTTTSAVQQAVHIPSGPATLVFFFHILDRGDFSGDFRASVGGTPVFTATDTTPGYASYTPVAVDLSGFSGGTRVIRFEGRTIQTDFDHSFQSDVFDVDGVSLYVPSQPIPTPADQGPGPPVAPSGLALPPAPPAVGSPADGLTNCAASVTVSNGGNVKLCDATNPPAANTTLTLNGVMPAGRNVRTAKRKKPRPAVLGRGQSTIPAGQTKPVMATLGAKARRVLARRGRLMVEAVVEVQGVDGQTATVTKTTSLRAGKSNRKRR